MKELLGSSLGLIFAGGLFVVWRICHKNSKPDTSKEGVELAVVIAISPETPHIPHTHITHIYVG
jgi:hypothetical protein